jgi:HEAT repeat protein
MAFIETDALLAHAIELAGIDENRDANEYWELIRVLHGRPEREVFAKAVACCTGTMPSERLVGADVLAQLGTPNINGLRPFTTETVPVLQALLADENEDVIASAIHALAHHRHAIVHDLRELARHESQPIRYAVAHALSGYEHVEAIALLIELTTDVDDSVRDWATFALGTQCDADGPEIRKALADRLRDSDDEVRGEAMVGLARRADATVIDCVAEALESVDPGQLVFDAADEILEKYPDESRIRTALAKWRTE